MAFNPLLPADHADVVAVELRAQFNGLKALIDDLQAQLAPLVPVVNRSAGGDWTLVFAGTAPVTWQVWSRYPGNEAWTSTGEIDFPTSDDALSPGTAWWQIKVCGEAADGKPCTPFSNVISWGPVP